MRSVIDRRDFIRQTTIGLIAVTIDGATALLAPSAARAAGLRAQVLTLSEVGILEAFGEVLLPGARDAGIALFIDHQLAVPSADSLLMLRYMDWPAPYAGFYKAGLGALDAASGAQFRKGFADLSREDAETIVRAMGQGQPPGWQGIPAPLFYFCVRSDAVDVVYGTEDGFRKLGVPYMAHILPPTQW